MAAAAGSLGVLILTLWFTKYWPASSWPVVSREQAIEKARNVAQQFGFKATNSQVTLTTTVAKVLAYYLQRHPADENARAVSPLSERISFASAKNKKAEVGLDSAGVPVYWRAPKDFDSNRPAASEMEAAQKAFELLSGRDASSFTGPSKSMADDPKDEEYVWKRTPPAQSQVRDQIKILAENTQVLKAQRTLSVASSEEMDTDTGDDHAYWPILGVIFWTICSLGSLVLIVILILWLVRRSLNVRFALTAAGVAAAVIAVTLLAGANAEKLRDDDGDWGGPVFLMVLAVFCLVAVGSVLSKETRPKWMSLEQLFGLAPLAKATGESLAAGVLCSPLLVAIPFLIAGCGLFAQSAVVAQDVGVLFSPRPLLDTLDIPGALYVLGFFGFALPLLRRMLRRRWLLLLIALPIGVVFFAYSARVVTGPIIAPLTAGFCSLALFGFLYKYFDLLAVLTLQVTSGLVLGMISLGSKGGSVWPFVVLLLALMMAALWLSTSGQAVAEGDPRAAIPDFSSFRAEREKLQAEFSVARRAQQGMLPQAPPTIPGYSIAASCTPSLEVGGDLYDFLTLPDGRIGIGVADVSGKGVPAALYMTLTKGLLASVSEDSSQLKTVVEEVNRHLHGVTRKKVFVTMALGFLDAEKRVLQCVRAGHNPMVWRQTSKGKTSLVAPAGLGLGITAGRIFGTQLKVEEMELDEGDAVVFYSDGITEAMNRGLEQFGEERLMEAVEKTDQMDAAGTHDSILSAVREFLGGVHPQDDMTLVVLRVGMRG